MWWRVSVLTRRWKTRPSTAIARGSFAPTSAPTPIATTPSFVSAAAPPGSLAGAPRAVVEELDVPVESIRVVRVELLFFPDQIIVRRRFADPSPTEPTHCRIEDRVYQSTPE